mmetsp:Transcript_7736/g.27056  ORF Transcript_7736/g.27056 Transcript_7736/m.27056 type:complete len:423 (+) Transcript_7736:604-1872(+)
MRRMAQARAERDKLKGQHARLRGEVDALSGTAKEAEGRARELDDALSRARKECRELRANESELRRERRDHVDGAFASATSSAVADLKRELELVQAQNDALRSDAVDAGATQRLARSAGQGPRRATPVAGPMPGAGRALNGSGRTLSEAADDDASTQLESTKLQRRCDGLEKKLVKKEVDLADARAKEKNARDLLDKARLRNESASASKGKERELEDLATTLQRALHRSNLENERLRSGPTESAKMHETQQLSAARRKVDELTEQLQAAQLRGATKAAWAGDAAPTDKVKALQRDLLLRDKEVAALRRARDDACSEKDALAEELDAQSRRMAQLERAVGRPGARGDARGDHAVARGDHAVGALQHEVADLRSELVATRRDASRFADAAAENTHLRSQLATFSDLASGRGHAQSRRDAYYGRTS